MNPSGILGHIAADGAGDLGRGVWGVEETQMSHGLGDRQVAHARLDPGGAGVGVDIQDCIEPRHAEQHAAGEGEGTAGQARAGTARHDGNAHLGASAQHRLNLRHGLGQGDSGGQGTVSREAIALIGLHAFNGRHQAALGQQGFQHRAEPRRVDRGKLRVQLGVKDVEHSGPDGTCEVRSL